MFLPKISTATKPWMTITAIDPATCLFYFSVMNAVESLPDVFAQDPDVMSGERVFRGTRIPAQTFYDHLDHGGSVDQFLEWYDGVSREQLEAAFKVRSSSSRER